MKKLIPVLFLFSLVACGKKEWSKAQLSKDCMKEMEKTDKASALMTKETMAKICDCAGDKMVAKYKSESEAKKDKAGAEAIGRDCAMEVMMGK